MTASTTDSDEIFHTTLHYNADSAEFCPIEGYWNYLAVGTYQLIEATKEKVGRIYLYSVNNNRYVALRVRAR